MVGSIIVNNTPSNTSIDTLTNLCAGNYDLLVSDDNGCSTSPSPNSFSISEPDLLVAGGFPHVYGNGSFNISCNGADDGYMVLIDPSGGLDLTTGGTPPYQYAVDSPSGWTTAINGLTSGNHTIFYQDDNGCLDSSSIVINEPSILELFLTSTLPASCFGVSDGTINAGVNGGSGPYVYSIDTANGYPYSVPILGSLAGGLDYEVFVMDDNSCVDSINVFLGQAGELLYSTVLSDYNGFEVSCFGSADGTVDFDNVIGGNGSYNYSCVTAGSTANYSSTSLHTGLLAGTYDLSVKDGNGCQKDTTIVLSEPGNFTVLAGVTSNFNGSQVSCSSASDGEIGITSFTNAVTPINYEFNNSGGFNPINAWSNLSAGLYPITAEDDNGCTANTSVSIVDPPTLTAISSSTDEFCNQADGTVSLTANGGTGSIVYSWSGPNGYISGNQNITNLEAGLYTCIITDINNCDISNAELVQDEVPFELTFTTTPTCAGNQSGTASVLVSALGSYTLSTQSYLWDDPNSQTTQTAIDLDLGTYTVAVNDLNYPTCYISESVSIDTTSTSIAISTIDINHITCNNANDGMITIHVSGGTQPYQYILDGGPPQSDSTYTGLSEGVHVVEVEDFSLCTSTQVINIINPPSLYIDTTIVNPVRCYGESNASIQEINAVGGTPPYSYSVNGGFSHNNMSYFINYGVGLYTVEVQDINNCFSQDIVFIEEPPFLSVTITTPELLWNNYQVRCYGDTNSYADISCIGGQSPYYNICIDSSGDTIYETSSMFSNLRQETYTFQTTDALGCVSSQVITYEEPTKIQHNFIPTHVTCNGWNNGSLVDSVSGGVGGSINAYSYLWNTGENTYAIDSIPIGDYIVTVTDMNNCISTDTFSSINNSNSLSASIYMPLTTDVSCYNYCDGEITVSATGGIPNINSFGDSIYYYLWNDTLVQSTQSATGLCVDNTTSSTTYSCIVTDMQGCSDTVSYTLTQTPVVEADASIVTDILCFGGDGTLTVAASGGTGIFTYMWSSNFPPTFSASPDINASAGDHIVIVKDQNGCIASDSITLIQPSEITLTVSNTDITCYGFGDGSILADADGGTPFLGIPPEYQYIFYDESGNQVNTETGVISETEGLSPGIYTVFAKDMNGCTVESGTIYISQPGDPLTVSFSTIDATCMQNNGEVTVFVFGGTPFASGPSYQYNWANGQSGSNLINLESGFYPITIQDNNNCTIVDSAFVVGVENVFLPNNLSAIEYTICLGDSVFINIDEHSGTTYQWENGSTVADRWVYPNQRENIYTLTILDVGCSEPYSVYATVNVDFVEAMLTSSPSVEYGDYPVIVNGDQIQISSNNNDCDSYQWTWDGNTDLNQSIIDDPDVSTWYYINIDSANCLGYDSIYVVVGVLPYEGITPNGDDYNDTWTPLDIESYPEAIVQVFNRWGGIVFESTGGEDYQAWDGTNEGKELPVGTYYYIIDLKTEDEPQTGPITIIR